MASKYLVPRATPRTSSGLATLSSGRSAATCTISLGFTGVAGRADVVLSRGTGARSEPPSFTPGVGFDSATGSPVSGVALALAVSGDGVDVEVDSVRRPQAATVSAHTSVSAVACTRPRGRL